MATATLRPNSTIANTGELVGEPSPPASVDAAWSDDSTNSSVQYDAGESSSVALGDISPALPAGAVVKSVNVRAKVLAASPGVTATLSYALAIGSQAPTGTVIVNWSSPTTIELLTVAAPGSEADVNAAQVNLGCVSLVGSPSIKKLVIYEAYLDVVYVPKPVVTVTGPSGTITDDDTPTVTWEMS